VHTDRPWEGARLDYGSAGAPCPDCNPSDEVTAREMPDDFVEDLNADDLPLPRETFLGKPEAPQLRPSILLSAGLRRLDHCRDLGDVLEHEETLLHPKQDAVQ
jgi:hypothetical protein